MISRSTKINYTGFRHPRELSIYEVAEMVPPGWRPLVRELCNKLLDEGWDRNLLQIKEKFGGLRFYTPIHFSLVDEYEAKSYNTCQECSSEAGVKTISIKGWLSTLCERCANDRTTS